jgi:hypothetical protein
MINMYHQVLLLIFVLFDIKKPMMHKINHMEIVSLISNF